MTTTIHANTTLGEVEDVLTKIGAESLRIHVLPAKDPHRFSLDGFVTTPSKSLAYVGIRTSTESLAMAMAEWIEKARELATGMQVVRHDEPKR